MGKMLRLLVLAMVGWALLGAAGAQGNPDWTTNHAPFRVIGNVYYVGSRDLASYLIVTRDGLILINSNVASSPPQIEHNVEALGFRFRDVKILLISHAHFDHDAGSAAILRMTGAKYMVMDADVPVVEDGGRSDFAFGREKGQWYAPAKVDRVLHDGDVVRLGGVELTAHKTAGHTKGCTTWTMRVEDGGRRYDVVIVGSPNVLSEFRLRGDPRYPNQAADFEEQFRVLEGLKCDVFLGAHGSYYGMEAKYRRLKAGDRLAFVDPEGYRRYVAERRTTFERALAAAKQDAERAEPGLTDSADQACFESTTAIRSRSPAMPSISPSKRRSTLVSSLSMLTSSESMRLSNESVRCSSIARRVLLLIHARTTRIPGIATAMYSCELFKVDPSDR
jgi:metallo-beta-lactamase class B